MGDQLRGIPFPVENIKPWNAAHVCGQRVFSPTAWVKVPVSLDSNEKS